MSSPQSDFYKGQAHVYNGGGIPWGTTNPHYFQGAVAESDRQEAAKRRQATPLGTGSGFGGVSGLVWCLLIVGLIAGGVYFYRAPTALNPTPSSSSEAAVPTWHPQLIPNRVTASTVKVRQWGEPNAPVVAQLRRGDAVYTTVRLKQQFASVYYFDGAGQKQHGFVLKSAIAED